MRISDWSSDVCSSDLISSAEHVDDLDRRDELEAGSLFDLLERQVVPSFYERWPRPVPPRWGKRMRRSLTTLVPFVIPSRMVPDYTKQLYQPADAQGDALSRSDLGPARDLALWQERTG